MKTLKKISSFSKKSFWLKTISLLITCFSAFSQQSLGQTLDDFTDGDLTANPTWSGTTSSFAVNASHQLQLNNSVAGTSYLSTPLVLQTSGLIEWQFYIKQTFSGSASNFSRVYIMSDQSNLSGNLNGYYLQFGEAGSSDAVTLFRQNGSTSTSILRGQNGAIASSFGIRVKITRSPSGIWELFIDYAGGTSFISQGSAADTFVTAGSYFGVRCTYSVSNATKFFFDDFAIAVYPAPDITPPGITALEVVSSTELRLTFSEEIDQTTAEDKNNFVLSNNDEKPLTAILQSDETTLRLVFSLPFRNGVTEIISINNVKDLSGNTMSPTSMDFMFFQSVVANKGDVVITEIFPDPSPPVGLPEYEFVEIYNRSSSPLDLSGWRITDGTSIGTLSTQILQPGAFVILSSTSAKSLFSALGVTQGFSGFPSLNNSGDMLKLLDPVGKTIDSINYSQIWYHNVDKQDGGWSLERIDPSNFCIDTQNNWTASINSAGGTPGKPNSVLADLIDVTGPKLLSVIPADNKNIVLMFDEKLASNTITSASFVIVPSPGDQTVSFSDPSLTKITLTFVSPLDSTITYSLTTRNIYDCPGNSTQEGFDMATFKLDNIPPQIVSVFTSSSNEINITFSERVDVITANNVLNYTVNDLVNPNTATLQSDQRSVRLIFATAFANGAENKLTVRSMKDISGNVMENSSKTFMFFQGVTPSNKSIVVSEIMADPSPPVNLPEVEYLELYNRTNDPFDLKDWKISDGTTTSVLPSLILLPHQYLIVSSTASIVKLAAYGRSVGASTFPSLNNTGDHITLTDSHGTTIDSVNYSSTWYKDSDKQDGGWSLELIDPDNICSESENWVASEDPSGGTPGRQNSVLESKPDLLGPKLVSVFPITATRLKVSFNEKLERNLPLEKSFAIVPEIDIAGSHFSDQSLRSLEVELAMPLSGGVRYELTVNDVYDCPGNKIQTDFNQAAFALPEKADSLDLVINEVLFNPRPTGVDFVEVYNRSSKYINLKDWSLVNATGSTKKISSENSLVAPSSFVVFTEDGNTLKGEYLQGIESTFVSMSMPSLPDDEGSIALVDDHQQAIDLFSYSEKFHSPFVNDAEGVSLERIDVSEQTNDHQNWKSASSTAGYATPGFLNSNSRPGGTTGDATVLIEPEIFMPLYGQPDFTQIRYNFDQGGYVANVKVIDPAGREIKTLANNELLGTEGFFRWEGDDENGVKARVGAYMVWFEVFDSAGTVKTFRKRVVVADKF